MTVFYTILAGVATLVLGQILIRLIIEPIHELKRTISDIAVSLVNNSNVFCNPGVVGVEREREVSKEIRNLASRLNAQMYLVPAFGLVRFIFGLPSKQNIAAAMKNMIGISNAVHAANQDMGTTNAKKSDKACDLLGIPVADEDRAG